ncbi:hypothetical protein [Shinella zoogloeoides]|jgi:hypothetical protein|uniref:hypothetical protein n=1 Tax=Shinella zoogloeoides TaxID=352475 RepID=UPI00273EC527|nr:hypothetical protein [Shinella zoogloeoides]WLR93643.1 hypothetical protein Q9316_05480 [Shinella zoogloeoides]
MNDDLIAGLNAFSDRLNQRARALSHKHQDDDTALLMQGLAITMEAVRSLGVVVNRLDGIPGYGRDGA